jgi:hypothetical protein
MELREYARICKVPYKDLFAELGPSKNDLAALFTAPPDQIFVHGMCTENVSGLIFDFS